MTADTKGAKPTSPKPKKPAAKKLARKAAPPKKPGRPTDYSEALVTAICVAIAEGMSLRKVCELETMPSISTVMRWLADERYGAFREQYVRAREAQADVMAEEILQIADDGRNDTQVDDEGRVIVDHDHIARSRLRVDARKWLASKMAPKKYGDKITAEHTGPNGSALQVNSTVTFVMPPVREEG